MRIPTVLSIIINYIWKIKKASSSMYGEVELFQVQILMVKNETVRSNFSHKSTENFTSLETVNMH